MALHPFHLAIPVHDIAEARAFYGGVLDCSEGRSSGCWVDFDFYGHQLVCHLDEQMRRTPAVRNPVDGHDVPVPHFGIVLDIVSWEKTAEKLQQRGVEFVIKPYIRFRDQPGEQATMFFYDPSGNAIEIKGFRDRDAQLFAE